MSFLRTMLLSRLGGKPMRQEQVPVEERLMRLERQLRRTQMLWAISTIVWVLLFVGLWWGFLPTRTLTALQARYLTIVDSKGEPRIELGTVQEHLVATTPQERGERFPTRLVEVPIVRLYDMNGKERITLRIFSGSLPEIVLRDQEGKSRVGLSVATQDAPGITLYDAWGRGRALLGLRADGNPILQLYDPQWQVLFEAP